MTATPEAQKGPNAAAAEKPPVVEMVDLYLTAEAVSIAVPIVAEAGIADLLLEGPRPVSALAAATGLDADALGRLLRLLANLGIFAENSDGEYVNTRLSETLAAGAPMSMRDIAAIALTPGWSTALATLPAAVREGGATAWDLGAWYADLRPDLCSQRPARAAGRAVLDPTRRWAPMCAHQRPPLPGRTSTRYGRRARRRGDDHGPAHERMN